MDLGANQPCKGKSSFRNGAERWPKASQYRVCIAHCMYEAWVWSPALAKEIGGREEESKGEKRQSSWLPPGCKCSAEAWPSWAAPLTHPGLLSPRSQKGSRAGAQDLSWGQQAGALTGAVSSGTLFFFRPTSQCLQPLLSALCPLMVGQGAFPTELLRSPRAPVIPPPPSMLPPLLDLKPVSCHLFSFLILNLGPLHGTVIFIFYFKPNLVRSLSCLGQTGTPDPSQLSTRSAEVTGLHFLLCFFVYCLI